MALERVSLSYLRVFSTVYRTGSMTAAATELHLTQSGVSQQIAALEGQLGSKLFDRTGRRIVPTSEARALHAHVESALMALEQGVGEVLAAHERTSFLSGSVRIGMPQEFAGRLGVKWLAEFSKQQPHVQFDVELGYAAEMSAKLVRGELDFAFVDDLQVDPVLDLIPIEDEELRLCVSMKAFPDWPNKKKLAALQAQFEALPYVDYQREDPLVKAWLREVLGPEVARRLRIRIRATATEAQSVAQLVMHGMGAGVLNAHQIEEAKRLGFDLAVIPGVLKNRIRLAVVRGRAGSSAARALQSHFIQRAERISRVTRS